MCTYKLVNNYTPNGRKKCRSTQENLQRPLAMRMEKAWIDLHLFLTMINLFNSKCQKCETKHHRIMQIHKLPSSQMI
jgi:hypothetical protein